MIFGILICGLAVIGLSRMSSLFEFYSLYMLMALGYMCGGPLPNQVLTSRWFSKARGKAMGIAYLGIGIGGMLVPQIAKWLNMRMDWRSSLFILGVMMIVIALPMALFVKENPPGFNAPKIAEPKTPFRNIFKNRSFYLLAIGSMCSIGAVAGISMNLKLFFSLDLNYTQGEAANVISIVLAASIIGRLLMGWLADRFHKKYVMILIYSLVSISILLLYFAFLHQGLFIFLPLFSVLAWAAIT